MYGEYFNETLDYEFMISAHTHKYTGHAVHNTGYLEVKPIINGCLSEVKKKVLVP
jgi:hypothetical protein